MRVRAARVCLSVVISALCAAAPAIAAPFLRTEARQACGGRDPASYSPAERRPFFGDLHVHTSYSIDAFVFNVRSDPRAAYDFARGLPLLLPSPAPDGATTIQLSRPLDFAAVTDHAEGFGPAYICSNEGVSGYDAAECTTFRDAPPRASLLVLIASVGGAEPVNLPMCSEPGIDCQSGAASIWLDEQAAAEEAYDRTSACSFTSFVAYEWTPMPGGANLHRNVIFRNERVPSKPIDYFETGTYDATRLWELLRERCLDRDGGQLGVGSGCDVLTIPHNSNLSEGLIFPDPADTDVAKERQRFEPLVEVIQHKGSSECRFDPTFGSGTGTTDEQCSFELLNMLTLVPLPGPSAPTPPDAYARRAYVRNVLEDGLTLEGSLGVNPFKLGMIGSTDTHASDIGNTEEVGYGGHVGDQDKDPQTRMSDGNIARFNPGGLAVVWAEENSRDSLFEAMRRRETYATSGTRPIVRFFGGWTYPQDLCSRPDQLAVAYDQGVPMGGDLPEAGTASAPRFFVSALKDSQTGTPLQRIQIVKGWVSADGIAQERVYDVDGGASAASVDPDTCEPSGDGAAERCALWTDPDFDAGQRAFYYARVLEDPSCRWHVFDCKALGVDPFAADCATRALTAKPGTNLSDCCRLSPTVQERAWTSPIWYEPRAQAPSDCAALCEPEPASQCESPGRPGAASLSLVDAADDEGDQLSWRWSGAPGDAGFGNPLDASDFALCVYDGSGLVAGACAAAAGLCDGKPCWKTAGDAGYAYKDRNRTPDGLERMSLKSPSSGKAKILVRAGGEHLKLPAMPLSTPVTVQLRNSDGGCWQAAYGSPKSNTESEWSAKAD